MDDIRERMCNNYCGFGVKFGAGKDIACKHCPLNELPKWIPVTERLPDFNTNVLVSYNNGTVSLAQFKEAFGTGYWFDYDNMCGSRKVIAWAPLPAPYVEPTDEPSTSELRGEEYWADQGDEE